MQSWVVQLITHCQWPLKGKACGKQPMTPSNDYCLFAVAFFLQVSLWTSWAACQADFIWEDLSKHCYRLSPHMQSFLAVRLFRQCTTSLFVSTLLASRQDLYCSISLVLSHLTCRGVSEHAEVFSESLRSVCCSIYRHRFIETARHTLWLECVKIMSTV